MDFHKIKLNNYKLYIFLIYVLWIISLIAYFIFDEIGEWNNNAKGSIGEDTRKFVCNYK